MIETKNRYCFLTVKEGNTTTSYIFKGLNGLGEAAAMKGALKAYGLKSTISTTLPDLFTKN